MATEIDELEPRTEFERMKAEARRWAGRRRSATLRRLARTVEARGSKPSDRELAKWCAARQELQARVNRRARRIVRVPWVMPR